MLTIDPTNPTTLYAGTNGAGLFKSTDGGRNWSHINFGITGPFVMPGRTFSPLRVNVLVIDPTSSSTLYAGSNDGRFNAIFAGVFKSTDGGSTWAAVNTGLTEKHVNALAIDPVTPTTVYVGTGRGGVFKSTDGGGSWTAINAGWAADQELPLRFAFALAIDRSNSGTVYVGTSDGVLKSTNGGKNWVPVGLPFEQVSALVVDPDNPATIYAATATGAISKSSNGGKTWTGDKSGLPTSIGSFALDRSTPRILYVGTNGCGVYKRSDTQTNWTASSSGINAASVLALALDPSNPATLYAGVLGGLFKSTNGGISWTPVKLPELRFPAVFSFAIEQISSSTVYVGSSEGVFKMARNGPNVSVRHTDLSSNAVRVIALSPPMTLYASNAGGLLKSVNGGASWIETGSGLGGADVQALAIDPSIPGTLYAGTTIAGIFKSTNKGAHWTGINIGLASKQIAALAIDPSATETVYAGTADAGVFKTTNGGVSWTAANSGITNQMVQALAIDPSSPTTIYAGTAVGLFKTADGGLHWTTGHSALTGANVSCLMIDGANPQVIYAGTFGGGVFKSLDGAATWRPTGASIGGGAAPAVSVAKVSGDDQSGAAGKVLRQPLVVVVTNAGGVPLAGVTVNFLVTRGGGTLSHVQSVTDSQGLAFSTLTLGANRETNAVTATAGDLSGSPLTFTAEPRP
jgi:photosystem II stability/assembly factor-like uncharacterized protein